MIAEFFSKCAQAFPSITSPAKVQHSAWPIWLAVKWIWLFLPQGRQCLSFKRVEFAHWAFQGPSGFALLPPFELSLRMLFQVSTTPLLVFLPTGTRRHSSLPLIPNLSEYGYSSFWLGLAVPQGTPDAIVKCLNLAVNNAFKNLFSKTALRTKYGPCWEADPKSW